MTLLELLELIRKNLKLVVALPVACAIVAAIVCWGFLEDQYTAEVDIYALSKLDSQAQTDATTTNDLTGSQMLANDISTLAESTQIQNEVAKELGLQDLTGYKISIESSTTSRIISIGVTGQSPAGTAAIAGQLVDTLNSVAKNVMDVKAINVVSKPEVPTEPSGPNRKLYVLVALLAGLFVAIAIIVLKDMIDTRIHGEEQAAALAGMPVVGRFSAAKEGSVALRDSKRKRKKNLPPDLKVVSNASMRNSASALFTNIRFMEVDKHRGNLVVTSSVPNEGKSTVAISLAAAIGAVGHKCLIVELDMRHRSLGKALGLYPEFGLGAVLQGECSVKDAVVPTSLENVDFLDAEPSITIPESVLDTKGFASLMQELSKEYAYVVYDTPPLAAFSDAAVAASKADGVLLVVRDGFTHQRDLAYACDALNVSSAHKLGLVVNAQNAKSVGAYSYSYAYTYREVQVPAGEAPGAAGAVASSAASSGAVTAADKPIADAFAGKEA